MRRSIESARVELARVERELERRGATRERELELEQALAELVELVELGERITQAERAPELLAESLEALERRALELEQALQACARSGCSAVCSRRREAEQALEQAERRAWSAGAVGVELEHAERALELGEHCAGGAFRAAREARKEVLERAERVALHTGAESMGQALERRLSV